MLALGHGFGGVEPKVNSLEILETTQTSIKLRANANVTNPTPYFATIPYVNVHIWKNESILASVTVQKTSVVPGFNPNVVVDVTWNPTLLGGEEGKLIGQTFLSQYVSGMPPVIVLTNL
jgi:hypothetical protein